MGDISAAISIVWLRGYFRMYKGLNNVAVVWVGGKNAPFLSAAVVVCISAAAVIG